MRETQILAKIETRRGLHNFQARRCLAADSSNNDRLKNVPPTGRLTAAGHCERVVRAHSKPGEPRNGDSDGKAREARAGSSCTHLAVSPCRSGAWAPLCGSEIGSAFCRLQKEVVWHSNVLGKPVYITRVMDSMVCSPRPTRAEARVSPNSQVIIDSSSNPWRFRLSCARPAGD